MEAIEEKKVNKFQWFVFTVLIPLLFAIVVALIVFSFAGVNVFEKAKEYGQKIPFFSSLVDKEEEKTVVDWETNIIELEAEIKDREAQISGLQTELDSKSVEVERANLEIEQLQIQIADLIALQEENKRAFKDIVRTYETMSAKKAAPIIALLRDEEAVKILTNLKTDTLAAIMEKMEPEDAAKYTELLTNENED